MALPKRNPLVWFLYLISILGMFGFIGWLLLPYADNGDFIDYDANNAEITTAPAESWQAVAAQAIDRGLYKPGQSIAGIGITLDLDGDLPIQIERHWKRFAKQDIAKRLGADDPKLVYAVYHHFDAAGNQVRMTLGYPTPPMRQLPVGLESVAIDAGNYLAFDGGYVLDRWADPSYQLRLKFDADYERYLLDSHDNILGQTAFLALK
ncbi:effector binding domain-containing protein [Motiliproteus sp.]|uniref:effector binding domain-containing protein n=1 Tax=Motiliproteus sp. TaxID=1898955 RepID=UPI003BAAC350